VRENITAPDVVSDEELFRRGARTLSQDLDRHFERLPLLIQRRYLQFDPCDRANNPPSKAGGATGGSLLGLADTLGAAAGWRAAPAPVAAFLRYSLDHLRNDQMLTPSSLARSFAGTPPLCNRCTAATLKFSSTFFLVLGIGEKGASLLGSPQALRGCLKS